MNASELADRLDKISYDCTIEEWRASPVGEAAAKLRQQQESIEGLTRDYDLLFAEHQLLRKKEWVGLSDEEITELHHEIKVRLMGTYKTEDIYRAIEAKLRSKNNV